MTRLLLAIACGTSLLLDALSGTAAAQQAILAASPPQQSTALVTKPNPPQGVSATVSAHQLTVSWLVLSDDGWGGPIDGYQVTVITPANQVLTQFSTTSPIDFTGLRHGTYQYYVGAHNADGWGSVSPIASIAVPSEPDRMSVPRASSVTPDTLTVTWIPPGSNGESPLTGYRVVFDGEAHDEPPGALQATYPAPGGTRHEMRVCARNAWGLGECSGTHYATAKGTPGPPQSVTATADGTRVSVTWTPPDNDGGRPVTTYRVRIFSGSYVQQTGATDDVEFLGLRPDTDYFVGVAATGYDPADGMGALTGPEYKATVHTGAAPASELPVVTIAPPTKPSASTPVTTKSSASTPATTAPAVTAPSPVATAPVTTDAAGSGSDLTIETAGTGTSRSSSPSESNTTAEATVASTSSSTTSRQPAGAEPDAASNLPAAVSTPSAGLPAWIWWTLAAVLLAVAALVALRAARSRG